MSLTAHHAKCFADDLTRRAPAGVARLSSALFVGRRSTCCRARWSGPPRSKAGRDPESGFLAKRVYQQGVCSIPEEVALRWTHEESGNRERSGRGRPGPQRAHSPSPTRVRTEDVLIAAGAFSDVNV